MEEGYTSYGYLGVVNAELIEVVSPKSSMSSSRTAASR